MSRSASPGGAALLSLLFSGLGHIRTGAAGAGVAFLILELLGWGAFVGWAAVSEALPVWLAMLLVALLVLRLASIIAAVVSARRSSKRGGILSTGLVLLVLPAVFLVQAFVFVRFILPLFVQLYGVTSSNMEPTLMGPAGARHPADQCEFVSRHRPPTGDHVMVSRMAYWTAPVRRFDVVVFRFPLDRSRFFVKRVVGLPGDELMLRNGDLHVRSSGSGEFEAVPRPPGLEGIRFRAAPGYRPDSLGEGQPVSVPEDSYFMLGDNSENSHDSRTWIRCVFEMKDGSRIECESQRIESSLLRIKAYTERKGLEDPPDVLILSDREGKERALYTTDIREERREPFRFVGREDIIGRIVKVWWPLPRARAVR